MEHIRCQFWSMMLCVVCQLHLYNHKHDIKYLDLKNCESIGKFSTLLEDRNIFVLYELVKLYDKITYQAARPHMFLAPIYPFERTNATYAGLLSGGNL